MADAKKCDRCGTFYEVYVPKKTAARLNAVDLMALCENGLSSEHLVRRMELCPACAAYIHAVLTVWSDDKLAGGRNG